MLLIGNWNERKIYITNSNGYTLQFHSGKRDKKGLLEFYSVTLTTPNAEGTFLVYNPPYGLSPTEFFNVLAKEWSGFRGEKKWRSTEGEFCLSAISDSTGHTYITADLCPGIGQSPPTSNLTVTYVVEAGQLEKIAEDIVKFFKYK